MGDIKKFIKETLDQDQKIRKQTPAAQGDTIMGVTTTVIHAQHVHIAHQVEGAQSRQAERSEVQTARFRALMRDIRGLVKEIRAVQNTQARSVDRERCYRVCHAIAKEYNLYSEMRALIQMRWQCRSLRDLHDSALHKVVIFMRALEFLQRAIPHISASSTQK